MVLNFLVLEGFFRFFSHSNRDCQSSLCNSEENEKLLASYLQIKEEVNFKVIEYVNQHGSEFAYPTQRTVGDKKSKD